MTSNNEGQELPACIECGQVMIVAPIGECKCDDCKEKDWQRLTGRPATGRKKATRRKK